MSSDIALRLAGVTKCYTIRHRDHDHITLAQAALHRLRHPRGGSARDEFWALRGVSLEVPRGEVLGVIGHNGAGKSTLLKVLSRITPPTSGRIDVFGRIGSLLEVGTGFHPELTGRENIFLNGAILGMKRLEIERRFSEIVEFSGVERFLDTPVKRYSSGMYVRLAFSVAAHLETEILLLDEVLAVGDPDFQQRSVAQIKQLAHDGRTVLFVSHNRDLVSELTTSAVALEHGAIVDHGPTSEVLERRHHAGERDAGFHRQNGYGTDTRLTTASARAERSDSGLASIVLDLTVSSAAGCSRWRPNFTLRGANGVPLGNTFGPTMSEIEPGETTDSSIVSDGLPLAPGTYSLDISIAVEDGRSHSFELADLVLDACTFSIPELKEGAWAPQWGYLHIRTARADVSLQSAVDLSAPSLQGQEA